MKSNKQIEKEFDAIEYDGVGGFDKIKSFIITVRQQDREELIKEIEKKQRTYSDICDDDKLDSRGKDDAWGYQRALTDIISYIKTL